MRSGAGQVQRAGGARLLVHVEGQTEESVVNEILGPHLYRHGYTSVSARLLGNARQRAQRGGIRSWPTVRKEIINHLKEDASSLATTMVDYYGMPRTGADAWPGRDAAGVLPFPQKAVTVQRAMHLDICNVLGQGFDRRRFIPYVTIHEFEGLLFSHCVRFAQGIGRPDLTQQFQEIRDGFESPEEINDSDVTAPSKRVEELVPGYEKPFLGTLAALEVGFDAIRVECPNFRQWLEYLEALPK